MDEPAALAERLRDITLPAEVAWWPPAPGWWALAVLAAAVIALALRRQRRGRLRRAALAELRRLEARWRDDGETAALAGALSALLRRVALARHPRIEVAGLTGEEWLAWLDRHDAGTSFSAGAGRALLTVPYGGGGAVDGAALLTEAERWLRANT